MTYDCSPVPIAYIFFEFEPVIELYPFTSQLHANAFPEINAFCFVQICVEFFEEIPCMWHQFVDNYHLIVHKQWNPQYQTLHTTTQKKPTFCVWFKSILAFLDSPTPLSLSWLSRFDIFSGDAMRLIIIYWRFRELFTADARVHA